MDAATIKAAAPANTRKNKLLSQSGMVFALQDDRPSHLALPKPERMPPVNGWPCTGIFHAWCSNGNPDNGKSVSANCALGIQRPLELVELSLLSTRARAEVALLQQTVFICESCGCVYVDGAGGTVHVENVPVVRR